MAEEAARPGAPWWLVAVAAVFVLALLVLYVRTGDAMLLLFGGLALIVLSVLGFLVLSLGRGHYAPPALYPRVVVRCASCGHENAEDAKFCNRCGKPLGPPPA